MKLDSPADAWDVYMLLHKKVTRSATFLCKSMESSTLPEAHRAVCPGRRRPGPRPRNSCDITRLTQYGLFWPGIRPESWFRRRQHGTCFSFPQTICSKSKLFVEKIALFPSFLETWGSESPMFPKRIFSSARPEAISTSGGGTA